MLYSGGSVRKNKNSQPVVAAYDLDNISVADQSEWLIDSSDIWIIPINFALQIYKGPMKSHLSYLICDICYI